MLPCCAMEQGGMRHGKLPRGATRSRAHFPARKRPAKGALDSRDRVLLEQKLSAVNCIPSIRGRIEGYETRASAPFLSRTAMPISGCDVLVTCRKTKHKNRWLDAADDRRSALTRLETVL